MTSAEQARKHNEASAKGWNLLRPLLLLDGRPQTKPSWLDRRSLRKAERCFREALLINPDGWQSMWALGKLHQVLGQHQQAFVWFMGAVRLAPTNPDVLREAGIEALATGNPPDALDLFTRAASLTPNDAGHHANRALALLLGGAVDEARDAVGTALRLQPLDPISRRIDRLLALVASGDVPLPRTLDDVVRLRIKA